MNRAPARRLVFRTDPHRQAFLAGPADLAASGTLTVYACSLPSKTPTF
jgi:hypothetical protein